MSSGQIRKKRKYTSDGRTNSTRLDPGTSYDVHSIDPPNGAPFEPDGIGKRFATICGIVARERVSINLGCWREVLDAQRESIRDEILKYFKLVGKSLSMQLPRVQRVALLTAAKAWSGRENRLVTEFMNVKGTPFLKFPFIEKVDWAEFVKKKTTDEFNAISRAKSELAKLHSCPHKMGTFCYSAMCKIWDKEDAEAISEGREPVLSHIKDPRARRWARARISSYDEVTGEPKFDDKMKPIYDELVRVVCMLIFSIT